MRRLAIFFSALVVSGVIFVQTQKVEAQGFYYVQRPMAYPSYSYYGGWYPGSYQNLYGNYGYYHVMTPYWNGGYRYRYW